MTDAKYARTIATGDNGAIVVKCDEPGPDSIYIHFVSNNYLGGRGIRGDYRPGTVRFDGDEPETKSWYYNGRSALLSKPDDVWAFVRRLENAKKLAVRMQAYDLQPYTTLIDVEGAAPTITQVVAACRATRR